MQKEVYEYISRETNDPIVEWKTCRRFGTPFAVFQSEIDLLDRISPVIGNEKFNFPLPTLSPEARQVRLMMFRNERKLYKRKCSKTGKTIVALYPDEYKGVVYNSDLWWSDGRDQEALAKEYKSDNFLKQLKELFNTSPYLNLFAFYNENSDYTNGSQRNKDCYMIFASDRNEKSCYSYSIFDAKNLFDSYGAKKCENSYEIIDGFNIQSSYFCQDVENCYNIYFSYGLKGCSNCLFCTNLQNKEYYVNNKFVGKEKRDKQVIPAIENAFKTGQISKYKQKLQKLKKGLIVRSMKNINSQNAIGDFITGSKNCFNSYELHNGEDVRNLINGNGCKDVSSGYVIVDNSQKVHEGIGCAANYQVSTVRNSRDNNRDVYFSNFVMEDKNMFGCVSMRNKEYYILNKKYNDRTKRENDVKNIIKELKDQNKRGEFFDPEFSPFPYNDTVAYEHYKPKDIKILEPEKFISKAIINFGGEDIHTTRRTYEREVNLPENSETITKEQIPQNIHDVNINILDKIIICEVSGRPFRIVGPELEFYRKHNLPIPTKHPDIRHEERLNSKPKRELHFRACDKCHKEMLSVYPQDSEFKVYCEECYKKEVY